MWGGDTVLRGFINQSVTAYSIQMGTVSENIHCDKARNRSNNLKRGYLRGGRSAHRMLIPHGANPPGHSLEDAYCQTGLCSDQIPTTDKIQSHHLFKGVNGGCGRRKMISSGIKRSYRAGKYTVVEQQGAMLT